MIDCFAFVYKTLARKGYKFPEEFSGYKLSNLKQIMTDGKELMDSDIPVEYFSSFCTEVDKAQEDDIVLTSTGVGIAINSIKFVSIFEKRGSKKLVNIDSNCRIFRYGKAKETIEPLEEVE